MLDYVALGILVVVALVLFYGIIAIHDIPYQIARRRGHPHQDAIEVAGWISLLMLHLIWPLLWIWATLYRPGQGWGFSGAAGDGGDLEALQKEMGELRRRLAALEADSDHTVLQSGN